MIFRKKDEPHETDERREEPEETALVPLAYFSSAAEAGMVCELLVNNGIRALLKGANFGALEPLPLPGGYSEVRLLVAQSDFMRAQQLYQAFFARPLKLREVTAEEQDQDDE